MSAPLTRSIVLKAIEQDDVAKKAQKQEKAKRPEQQAPPPPAQVEEQVSEPAPAPKRKTGSLGNFF